MAASSTAVLGQGLVLMVAGMGIVYLFLLLLVAVTGTAMKFFARFDGILGAEAPKKPAAAPAAGDADVALAIAVPLNR